LGTKRQRGYAAAAGDSTIYTPQMVIGGKDHIIGTRSMSLVDTLNKHIAQAVPLGLKARQNGGTVSISADAAKGVKGGLIVQLVSYSPKETVSIRRGENAGREMTYHNVVKGWSQIADWDGGCDRPACRARRDHCGHQGAIAKAHQPQARRQKRRYSVPTMPRAPASSGGGSRTIAPYAGAPAPQGNR